MAAKIGLLDCKFHNSSLFSVVEKVMMFEKLAINNESEEDLNSPESTHSTFAYSFQSQEILVKKPFNSTQTKFTKTAPF